MQKLGMIAKNDRI